MEVGMRVVNMFEAKSSLSRLVEEVESGRTRVVVIARAGKPAARLVPVEAPAGRRLGIAKGQFVIPESIDGLDVEVAHLFGVGAISDTLCGEEAPGDDEENSDAGGPPECNTARDSR
jgi:prevent-host-death family protein